MNILIKSLFLVFMLASFVFSRAGVEQSRGVKSANQSNKHYWIKDVSDDEGKKNDRRKRSHKRRRKIKRPKKGLR